MHELAVMSLSLPAEALLEQLPGAPHACHSPGQHWLFCLQGRTPPTALRTSAAVD